MIKKGLFAINSIHNYTVTKFPTYPQSFCDDELDYLIAHQATEIILDMGMAGLQDTTHCQLYIDSLHENFVDHGFNVTVGLEMMFGHNCGVFSPDGYLATQPYTPREIPDPVINFNSLGLYTEGAGDMFTASTAMTPAEWNAWTKTIYYAGTETPAFPNGLWPCQYWDTPKTEYNDRYGDCLDLLNASDITTYFWECGHDNGIEWLHENTSKKLVQFLAYGEYGNNDPDAGGYLYPTTTEQKTARGITGSGTHIESWRLNLVDKVICEQYQMYPQNDHRLLVETCATNHPTLEVGVTSAIVTADQWFSGWSSTNVEVEKMRFKGEIEYLDSVHTAHGGSGLSEIQLMPGWWRDMPNINYWPSRKYSGAGSYYNTYSPFRIVDFIETLDLEQGTGGPYVTKPVQDITNPGVLPGWDWPIPAHGYFPFYSKASECTHEATKPADKFANTGREILVFKNTVFDESCRYYHITVGETEYDLNIPYNRCAFIGPFSTDDYGFTPAITYNNTQLGVMVLKT